jgi:hypothetical protein
MYTNQEIFISIKLLRHTLSPIFIMKALPFTISVAQLTLKEKFVGIG